MINQRARANRGKVHKSTMGVNKNKFWLVIFSLFAIWLLLISLNNSSLFDSVASIARLYIYSTNYQQPLLFISNQSDAINTTINVQDDFNNVTISIREKTGETEAKTGETEGKTGEIQSDFIDKLIDVNTADPREKSDQPMKEMIVLKEKSDEIPQQISTPRRKRRRGGRSKRRRSQVSNGELNTNLSPPPPPPPPRKCTIDIRSDPKSCSGRWIFVHTLPRRFNVDLLRDCKSLDLWMDMCQYVRNSGLGPVLPNTDRVFSENGWFATNQFLLEVIFHNRMKQYDCLTNDSSIASAIFVPFYVGLDLARHLWNSDSEERDSGGFELIKWLKRKPEWKRWWGRDHFFIAGRITWDFRRSANTNDPDWGTKFLYLPESKNMTALVIESSPWNNNDFGIPYPTYFHPANDEEVFQWQENMRKQRRRHLFCFAGAPRPDRPDSIRNQLITQCESSKKCMMIHCNNWKNKCHKPAELMKMFQNSIFCLQPPGDSYTRRSTFDSILAGCIPVFFHPGSAYIQYLWHFPREFTKYSVFIPMYDIKDGKVSIQRTLESIPPRKISEMREEIISLIPKIIYADPRCRLETLDDAFDVSVKGVLERVERIKRDMREGRNDSFAYDERQAWKYRWLGKLEEHEWDPYFSGSSDTENFNNF